MISSLITTYQESSLSCVLCRVIIPVQYCNMHAFENWMCSLFVKWWMDLEWLPIYRFQPDLNIWYNYSIYLINFKTFLTRTFFGQHHVCCRPLDLTLHIWSNFVKEKEIHLSTFFLLHLVGSLPKSSPQTKGKGWFSKSISISSMLM